jgi:hypothetical protein
MAITLAYGGTTVELSDRLQWTDEFDWNRAQQSASYSVAGSLIVQVAGAKQAGRPITLDGTGTAAWTSRGDCETLRAWADVPGAQLQLTLRGVVRTVIFDQERGAFESRPLVPLLDSETDSQDLCLPTIRLMTV